MLSDLRESGALEQDADLVMFIFRPAVYERENPERGNIAEIIIAKQRNGPIGTATLAFINRYTRFENMALGGYQLTGAPPGTASRSSLRSRTISKGRQEVA